MPFIFGMLTMIGIAAAAIIVVGIVKIFKQTYRVRNVESTIERIWSTMDTKENNVYKTIDAAFAEIYRKIDSIEEGLSRRVHELGHCIDERVSKEVDCINLRIDNLETAINTQFEDVYGEIDSKAEYVEEQISNLEQSMTDGDLEVAQAASDAIANAHRDFEEKARNTSSYIDSRIDKVREEFSSTKKELLKG